MSSRPAASFIALAIATGLLAGSPAVAATKGVLGSKFQIKDPGTAAKRRIVGVAKERSSATEIVGDPRVDGAELRVIVTGGTDADETFVLPMGGWTAVGPYGYRYSNRFQGGAVRKASIKHKPGGTFLIKVQLSGKDGELPVVPPNPGTAGGFILKLTGGDNYCVGFGGPAGGSERRDDASEWSVRKPTTRACPPLDETTTTSTTTTTMTGATTTTMGGSTTTTTLAIACGAPPPPDPPLPPDEDPFYEEPAAPLGAPGTVLKSRQVAISGFDPSFTTPFEAWQIMYSSNNAKEQPAAAVATIIRPCTEAATTPRPLVSYQTAEDSCSMECAPSYRLRLGTEKESVSLPPLLANGWMVVVPDYEGLLSSYGAGRLAARTVLDGIRATENFAADNFPEWGLTGAATPVGLWGYSGGGLATMWATETAPVYAPELNIAGATPGGVPPDIRAVADNISGGPFSSIMLSASVGISLSYPEIEGLMNEDPGQEMRDYFLQTCIEEYAGNPQYQFQTLDTYTIVPNPLDYCCEGAGCAPLPELCIPQILAENHLGHVCSELPFEHCSTNADCSGGGVCRVKFPTAPIYIFHAVLDELIPVEDVNELVEQYCDSGVHVTYYQDVASEHISLAVSGAPAAVAYLQARFAGVLPPSTCGLPTLP